VAIRGRSRGLAPRARSPRRLTRWFRSVVSTGPTSLAAATAVLDQSLALDEPATVVRIRGSLWIQSDQEAASENQIGAVGACVVSDQALAIGITAVPTPTTDADSDLWVMHRYFADHLIRTASGMTQGMAEFPFDSKGMRKLPDGTSLAFVVENSNSSHGLQFVLQFATLVKLA